MAQYAPHPIPMPWLAMGAQTDLGRSHAPARWPLVAAGQVSWMESTSQIKEKPGWFKQIQTWAIQKWALYNQYTFYGIFMAYSWLLDASRLSFSVFPHHMLVSQKLWTVIFSMYSSPAPGLEQLVYHHLRRAKTHDLLWVDRVDRRLAHHSKEYSIWPTKNPQVCSSGQQSPWTQAMNPKWWRLPSRYFQQQLHQYR